MTQKKLTETDLDRKLEELSGQLLKGKGGREIQAEVESIQSMRRLKLTSRHRTSSKLSAMKGLRLRSGM